MNFNDTENVTCQIIRTSFEQLKEVLFYIAIILFTDEVADHLLLTQKNEANIADHLLLTQKNEANIIGELLIFWNKFHFFTRCCF
jgi:hypothetical protein